MDYDWELRAGRVIRRLRIDRRNNSTRDLAKDGTVQRLHGLNGARNEKMAATTQTVMVVVSRVWRRSLLRAFCCRESRRLLLRQRYRPVFSAGVGHEYVLNAQAETNQGHQEKSHEPS